MTIDGRCSRTPARFPHIHHETPDIPGGVARGLGIELNALNTIAEAERKGKPRDLIWPWFAANVSVFGISYGAFLLGFGISFGQAVAVGLIGIVSLAGTRGSAPTMALSRAAFGVNGNRVPSVLSWLLTVGWETVLASLAVLATSTVLTELGLPGGVGTKLVALAIIAGLIVLAGVVGFDLIMRLQTVITIVTGVLTVVYIVLVLGEIDMAAVSGLPAGAAPPVIGGLVFMMIGFGLGW
jgi:purine-cytosine permease-like protein